MEDDAVAGSGAWKFHDFRDNFHAGRAGHVKGGVELATSRAKANAGLSGMALESASA